MQDSLNINQVGHRTACQDTKVIHYKQLEEKKIKETVRKTFH